MVVPRAYRRFFVVAYQFLPLLVSYARDKRRFLVFGRSRTVTSRMRRERARSLLSSLLELGPTFIKLGQLLSTRPDILPPEYIDEFEELQDRVPPAAWSEAREVVEAELGPVDERFDTFDVDAISGASLGQVYAAHLDDRRVAVKVRRPGVEALVEADLRVITFSLPLVMWFVDESRSFSMQTLADEFAKVIREEMDYERERAMLEEIRANFADDDRVHVPRALDSHSTERVLTMEYVPGTKISDIQEIDELAVDRTRLARTIQQVYLEMIVDDGVFHADPHPGNLAVQDDGTLVFYDFGMSGRVDRFVQDRIVDFYIAVARQDTDAILDTLIEMGTLSPTADREVMANVMELAIADARGQDIEQYRVQQIVSQVEDTIYEFPLRLPPNLALVLRVATVVEGVCITLDEDFDFIEVATDYLRTEGYLEQGVRDFIQDRAEEVRAFGESTVRVPPKLENVLDTIERENLVVQAGFVEEDRVIARFTKRIVLGALLSATIVATAIVYAFRPSLEALPLTLLALFLGVLLWRSFRKHRGIRASPQFTRQNLRDRKDGE